MVSLYRASLVAFCLASALPLAAQAADAPAQAADPAAASAPTPRPPLADRSADEALALQRRVPKEQQRSLEANGESFLALWKPANDTDPHGAVIIVPGAGENADWPIGVGPLRQKLPDAGWHSLSVTLPDLVADMPQARAAPAPTPAAAPAGQTAPAKDTPDDANANVAQATSPDADTAEATDAEDATEHNDQADAERIFARLQAAISYAQQQNARSVVLLGQGSGAYWAARFVSEKQPPEVQKLVLVAAQTPARVEDGLPSLVPTLKVPTADIYYALRSADKAAAEQRLQASKRVKDSQYRQLSLIATPGDSAAQQEQLFRRVKGWLAPQQ
ncbi:alpha/beta hydrolase family protein [Pseudomonas cremoricolorata]|uniref:alpha/beta hydrolase family protein n=1 Tax=Pseudomonas cremoricolorata TaxID=157783 RepID=UPI000404936B|nr:alpha/beta hydrolase family protein [Pseudomonas cremoricolorata]